MAAAGPGTVAPLSGGEAAAIGLVALLIVLIPFLVPVAGHFDAMAHEGLHALVAAVLGFELVEVVLNRKANGVSTIKADGFSLLLLLLLFFLVGCATGTGGSRSSSSTC